MEDKKFIITSNPESAALLTKAGLKPMFDDGQAWIFYNNSKLVFAFIILHLFSVIIYSVCL